MLFPPAFHEGTILDAEGIGWGDYVLSGVAMTASDFTFQTCSLVPNLTNLPSFLHCYRGH